MMTAEEDASDDDEALHLPARSKFRARAHCNPLSDRGIPYPLCWEEVDWSLFYPEVRKDGIGYQYPTVLDIGCGYGGMSFAAGELFPNELVLGLEIRLPVARYVQAKIDALRGVGQARNVAVQWANSMQSLVRYIRPQSLQRMFVLFPDPHFKRSKEKWRVISAGLLDEYAFVLRPGGLLYLVTDVPAYMTYAVGCFAFHPLFKRVATDGWDDPAWPLAMSVTEESRKVAREGRSSWGAVWRRV